MIVVRVDLADRDETRRLIAEHRPRGIIHAAGLANMAQCERQPDLARRDIVEATDSLLDAVARESAKTPVLFVSTDLVFDGEHPPYRVGDRPFPLSTYGRMKLLAEDRVLAHSSNMVVRASLFYGPPTTNGTSFLGWMMETLQAGKRLVVFEDEFRTPLFVDDLVTALYRLIDQPRPGIHHAAGPERLNRVAMGRMVCEVLGFDDSLLDSRRLDEVAFPAPRPHDVTMDADALWSALNIKPRSFRAGLRLTQQAMERTNKRSETMG